MTYIYHTMQSKSPDGVSFLVRVDGYPLEDFRMNRFLVCEIKILCDAICVGFEDIELTKTVQTMRFTFQICNAMRVAKIC